MTVNNPAAFGAAVAHARHRICPTCKCGKDGRRFCPTLGYEMPKQCCICLGGHECRWWDLCEAGQNAHETDWGAAE